MPLYVHTDKHLRGSAIRLFCQRFLASGAADNPARMGHEFGPVGRGYGESGYLVIRHPVDAELILFVLSMQ